MIPYSRPKRFDFYTLSQTKPCLKTIPFTATPPVPRAFPLKNGWGRPTLFLREKPRGRGCLHSGTYLYITYIAVSPPGFPREVVESKPFLSFPPPPPTPPFFGSLSPVHRSRNNSIRNACYAGYFL